MPAEAGASARAVDMMFVGVRGSRRGAGRGRCPRTYRPDGQRCKRPARCGPPAGRSGRARVSLTRENDVTEEARMHFELNWNHVPAELKRFVDV
jgi:hypothetical protein